MRWNSACAAKVNDNDDDFKGSPGQYKDPCDCKQG